MLCANSVKNRLLVCAQHRRDHQSGEPLCLRSLVPDERSPESGLARTRVVAISTDGAVHLPATHANIIGDDASRD